jgi:peptide-methionine (S)-S-oxide reductase
MRQGNDVGTQYRSLLGWYDEHQRIAAEASRNAYQHALDRAGFEAITTELVPAPTFYFAEAYHQQYLHTHPNGYCGIGGTNVSCPIGVGV